MRIAGIICEYNPLHSGHYEQIQAVKAQSDALVCLMSGSFVQRGEPAMFHKFARAKWALQAGADAVFELPTPYSLSSAEGFARGGMRILDLLGIDELYFGSECAMPTLRALADVFLSQPPAFGEAFSEAMGRGLSYAAAKERAARAVLPDLCDEAFMRNAVLGVEYLLALRRINSDIVPVALNRFGDVSASRIRKRIRDGEVATDRESLPVPAFVQKDIPLLVPVTFALISDALLYRLRTMEKPDFASLPGISEGLENRLYAAAQRATSGEDLLFRIAHRRMPQSRIRRALMCALVGITESMMARFMEQTPGALRLLGMREGAKALISRLNERTPVHIVTQPAHHKEDEMMAVDVRATDIHALFAKLPCGLDYTNRLITI